MHLFKNGNKYYLSKIGTKNYLWDDDYIIENGQLKWGHPNLFIKKSISEYPYIDTGFVLTTNSVIECDFSFDEALSTDPEDRNHLCINNGGYTQTNNFSTSFWSSSDSKYKFWFCVGTSGAMQYSNAPLSLNTHFKVIQTTNLNLSPNKLINRDTNTVIYTLNNIYGFDGTATTTLKLFINSSARENSSSYKMHNFKIWDNQILVRSFIPVPTNMIIGSFTVPSNGMFDIVNQQFYANQGSGTFTYGKDS